MIYKQSSRLLHHTITTTASFTFSVPSSEDPSTWISYDLGLSEIGVREATKQVYIRVGSDIVELTNQCGCTGSTGSSPTQSVNPQLNDNIPGISVATPTLDQGATLYTYDMAPSGATMLRFDSYATLFDAGLNKYYTWQHVAIVKNAAPYAVVREYYTKEDLDGQSADVDFTCAISSSNISFGFIRPTGSPITGDGMGYTNISYM